MMLGVLLGAAITVAPAQSVDFRIHIPVVVKVHIEPSTLFMRSNSKDIQVRIEDTPQGKRYTISMP